MTDSTHQDWLDTAAAYLLDALPGDERAGFEAHMEDCPECRREVDRLRVAADALGAAPLQLQPPPELRDRIMSVVRAEAELLQAAGARADVPDAAERRARFAFRRRGWLSLRPATAFAAAAAMVVAGVVFGVAMDREADPVQQRTIVADVTPRGAGASLELRDDRATLLTRRMPPPGRGRDYQVWIKRPGQLPEPTDALFEVGRDGSARVEVPASTEGLEAIMVTSEPDGGSPRPTTDPVIVAPLT